MATDQIRSLAFKVTSELQMIMGASELGDLDSSLRAVGRAHAVLFDLQREIIALKRKKRVTVWPKGAQ
jgi:hypothetical protein